MTSQSTESQTPVKAGELVSLDYEIWAEGGGRTDLIDTTREEVAQQAGAERGDGSRFAPRPHLIGGEFFPSGIEKGLEGLVPGQEVTKTFPPAEAFGERDPKLIELFGMHEIQRLPEMRREDARLDIGTVLTIRGRRGRVVSLTAARVRVDFNPPYAGRTVRGTFKVLARIDAPADQARAMVELHYGHGSEFKVEMDGSTLHLHLPDRAKFDLAWVATKPRLIEALRRQVHPKEIRIVEEFVTPESPAPAAGGSETAPSGAPPA
jgi:FKBP-type peptidyl-prolyl cis-trans isomerase SlyD